jgi:hypothetical protein
MGLQLRDGIGGTYNIASRIVIVQIVFFHVDLSIAARKSYANLAFALTQGQPWLVNALARQITEVIAPNPATAITPDLVETISPIWLNPAGELDTEALLTAFLNFWRQHGEPLIMKSPLISCLWLSSIAL